MQNSTMCDIKQGGFVRHCCEFKADDIYYLKETNIYVTRKLSIGFCPICNKPVAELVEFSFNGGVYKTLASGVKANDLVNRNKEDILYSMKSCNYLKFKSKPYGWKYGINKQVKLNGKERIKQYAGDFYGNKEIIKIV